MMWLQDVTRGQKGRLPMTRLARSNVGITLIGLLAWTPKLAAQGVDYIKAHYTKTEHQIPMRDGVRLFTAVYTPKDTSRTYPILLTRTQSGVEPYGVDNVHKTLGPSALFGKEGFIFVYQDIRGRWASEGNFVRMRPHNPAKGPKDTDESTDTYDTIEWLLKKVPGHNDKVGHWGMSYRGWLVAAGILCGHPALKAASPQAPVMDTFAGDDWHHNGATFLAHAFYYAHRIGVTNAAPTKEPFYPKPDFSTPDGYCFFLNGTLATIDNVHFKGRNLLWNDLINHPTYDDAWKSRNLRPHLKNIKPALLTVGGWFDAENLFGVLEAHRRFVDDGANELFVMGPWIHGGWNFTSGASLGPVEFGSKTADTYREEVELPFFKHHLKGTEWKRPTSLIFETGTNRWHDMKSWPPKEAKPLTFYFHEGCLLHVGGLHPEPPDSTKAFDEFVSDPNRPVPFTDQITNKMIPEYMCADQRFASRRPDVLVYQTPPLNKAYAFAGPIEAHLHVSTTGTDSDWIVKLIDVYPDDHPDPTLNPSGVKMGGYQQLVRAEVMRGRFRSSLEKPEPFEPGRVTKVDLKLPDVFHTFRPGHRIMVQVHSTWFPLVDLNPQSFVDIAHAGATDFRKATQRVYRKEDAASRIVVHTLP
jgi:putative CocE/NonD family hydrolase